MLPAAGRALFSVAMADLGRMRFGIEAEFALVHPERGFCDFTNLAYAEAQAVVDRLPDLGDTDLTRGDLLVKVTRWYVEGDERFAEDGTFVDCVPKGLETRTPVCTGIAAAAAQLAEQTAELAARGRGGRLPAGQHRPQPLARLPARPGVQRLGVGHAGAAPGVRGPEAYMVGYGPDLNLSHPDWPSGPGARRRPQADRAVAGAGAVLVLSPFAGGEAVALSRGR